MFVVLTLIGLAAAKVLWAGSAHVTRREAMKDPAYRLKVQRHADMAAFRAELAAKERAESE